MAAVTALLIFGGEIGFDGVKESLDCTPCSPEYTYPANTGSRFSGENNRE